VLDEPPRKNGQRQVATLIDKINAARRGDLALAEHSDQWDRWARTKCVFALLCGFAYPLLIRFWVGKTSNLPRPSFEVAPRFPSAEGLSRIWANLFVWPWNLFASIIFACLLIYALHRRMRAWPFAIILGTFLGTLMP
jgi:hypothetical protein